jgi:4-hydroxy 2-oxovalerate aldolase
MKNFLQSGLDIERLKNLMIVDSTLRDGSHAMRHKFTAKHIREYACAAEKARVKVLVAGHGNGLGASSLQLGSSLVSDEEFITIVREELKRTKLGVFIIPGFGTIERDLEPAMKIGAEVVFVASHCSEADTTQKHIEYVRARGGEAIGVLMMSHMLPAKGLLLQAKKMEGYGASGVMLMDSAGASLPRDVREKVSALARKLSVRVGFHAHNNLGLAVANSVAAIESGALIIDTTSRGFGAGAGNCPLEVLASVLHKMEFETGMDIYKLMDNSDNIVTKFSENASQITGITITSGLAGVFSGFCPLAVKAGKRFNVDPRDILMELGKRKIVAGQEDYITDISFHLKGVGGNGKKTNKAKA